MVPSLLLGPPAARAQPRAADASAARDLVTLNFRDADLDVVLDAITQTIGLNYVLAPEIRRKVTIQGRVPRRELLDLLLAMLEVHGLTAVRSGNLYKIVRIAPPQSQGVPVVIGPEPDPTRRPEEIVTQIIHLSYGSAAEVARVLQPMISREGTMAVHREPNMIVITDSVDKLRRYLSVIRMLDVPLAQEQFRILPLRFADAGTLAPLVAQLVGASPGAPSRSVPGTPARGGDLPDSGPPGPGAGAPTGARELPAGGSVILADSRTNALLVAAPPAVLERIQALVARLDTETPPARGVFLYRVEHLRAKEVAGTLTALFRRRSGPEAAGLSAARPGPVPPPPPEVAPGGPPSPPGAPSEGEREELVAAEIRIIPDEATNTLLITATPQMWATLQPILQRLDRMPRRVLIEILVAEFMLDDNTSLGIEWALRSDRGIRIGGERLSVSGGLDTGQPGIQPIPPTFFFVLQNKDILLLLQAFTKANRVNILSSPHVLTSENKKAQIHVGRSVPILTTQQQPTTGIAPQAQPASVITTTVDYRDTGIILTVTPRVSDDRFVALDVRQEVSDAVENTISGTQSPIFTKRVAETSVVVGEHETLVLGGLIEERKVQGREGIPVLSRIPILGYLFGTTTEAVRKTELMILVTPRIVLDPAESQSLYEEFTRRAPELRRQIESSGDPAAPVPPPRSFGPEGGRPLER